MSVSHAWISGNKQNHIESLRCSELQRTSKITKAAHHRRSNSSHLQTSSSNGLWAHTSQGIRWVLTPLTLSLDLTGVKKVFPVPQLTFVSMSHWQTELIPLSWGIWISKGSCGISFPDCLWPFLRPSPGTESGTQAELRTEQKATSMYHWPDDHYLSRFHRLPCCSLSEWDGEGTDGTSGRRQVALKDSCTFLIICLSSIV